LRVEWLYVIRGIVGFASGGGGGGGGGGISEMRGDVLLPRAKVITTHRDLLTKLPLPTAAALMWTMHYHSFVPPAAAAAAPAMRCCSRRGQLPDDPWDPPTSEVASCPILH